MNDFYDLGSTEQERRLLVLAGKALENWALEGSELTLIKHRENAVYRVMTHTGERHALRIHRANYHTDAALRSELQWIDALDRFGIHVPAVVPTAAGDWFAQVSVAEVPDTRQVDLFQWVDGDQLGSVEDGLGDDADEIRNIYLTIGEIAGKLHNQATAWPVPEGFERHAWDVDGLVGEEPLWGRFWALEALTPEQRELIERARAEVRRGLLEYGQSPENYSMIHADFVPENFLVDGDKVRLIDFDDAGFGWHLFEIATALYFIQNEPHYQVARDALIEGYRRHRPISDQALADLPLFIAARSFTYLGWVHTRKGTETAEELTPLLVEMCCSAAERYLGEI